MTEVEKYVEACINKITCEVMRDPFYKTMGSDFRSMIISARMQGNLKGVLEGFMSDDPDTVEAAKSIIRNVKINTH